MDKNKKETFASIILIVFVLGLSFLYIRAVIETNTLKEDKTQLENTATQLKSALEIEEKLRMYSLKDKFSQDCRYRNYSYYDSKGSFCCKWVNENRICMDWLTVVSETPITVNPHNFISQNATILIESYMGFEDEITITLDEKYDDCDIYDYYDEIVIRCEDYD